MAPWRTGYRPVCCAARTLSWPHASAGDRLPASIGDQGVENDGADRLREARRGNDAGNDEANRKDAQGTDEQCDREREPRNRDAGREVALACKSCNQDNRDSPCIASGIRTSGIRTEKTASESRCYIPFERLIRLIKVAIYAAPNPLSIFTTLTFGEHELSIPKRAANPPNDAP